MSHSLGSKHRQFVLQVTPFLKPPYEGIPVVLGDVDSRHLQLLLIGKAFYRYGFRPLFFYKRPLIDLFYGILNNWILPVNHHLYEVNLCQDSSYSIHLTAHGIPVV
jgi:hypothetical protein